MRRIVLIAAFALVSVFCFSQENTEHIYLSMIKHHHIISISIGSESFEMVNVKSEVEDGNRDLRPVHKRISEFEKDGWELVSTENWGATTGPYAAIRVLMRKKK